MTAEKPLSERIDDYIADVTTLGVVEDLERIPKRSDYPTQAAWMRALEDYRDGVIAPTEENEPA
jgi:hypothetical protein